MIGAPSLIAIVALTLTVQGGAANNPPAKPAATPVPPKLEPPKLEPPRLEPLRPARPTPAQRVMPGVF